MKKDAYWGYFSQLLQYGAALIVLPLLLKRLSAAELGVWYVFMAISAMVTLLDLGFTPTLTRNVSYVLGGAKRLLKHGYEPVEHDGDVDYALLKIVIRTARRIFLWIAVIALVLLIWPGSIYIEAISKEIPGRISVYFSWMVFVSATILGLFYKYYTPLLQGRSLFVAYYKANAIANLSFIGVAAVLLILGLGLPAVALGFLTSALVGRWLSWRYLYDDAFTAQLNAAGEAAIGASEVFDILFHNAWRLGLGVIGAFLILRANTLLSSAYLGLETTSAYALTLQVMSALQGLATVLFNIQLPKLAQHRVADRRDEMVKILKPSLLFAIIVFVLGAAIVVWIGSPLIRMIGGNTDLLPRPLLAWVGLMTLLELCHSLAAGVILLGNQVPFVKAALVSGILIALSAWIGLAQFHFSVPWLIGSQFFVQLCYNNWYWPWRAYMELRHYTKGHDA